MEEKEIDTVDTDNKSSVNQGFFTKSSTMCTMIKQSKFEYAAVNILCILTFAAFAYLAIMSFIQTSIIDPENYVDEVILYQGDNIPLNILITILFAVFVFKMKKHCNFFARVDIKIYEILLATFVAMVGIVWIFSVTSFPAADSYSLFETATDAINGEFRSFIDGEDFFNCDYYGGYSYYNLYPFQLGYVLLSEIVYRIFGAGTSMPMQILNVLCVALTYLGIAKITGLLFKRVSVEFFAIVMLAGCFQPILFCTFAYGNVIGMCCAVWASFFLIKYFQSNKYIKLIPCCVLLTLAILVKYNNMIYLIAFVIILVLHAISQRKWQSIAFALAICIAATGASSLVIMSYESRAGVKLKSGMSQVLYLDMGINESIMAPGWYNEVSLYNYIDNECSSELADAEAWNDIDIRISAFKNVPEYAVDFFTKKILSQWNEPTYESIWVSKVKGHYNELGFIGKAMYGENEQGGSLGQFFELYFNFYMQILFIMFAAGVFFLLFYRKANVCTVLFPFVLLGGFGYHLLFEGKSQYILVYIPLLIPTASYALRCILDSDYSKIRRLVSKSKEIPV